jgi:hypothetical protein
LAQQRTESLLITARQQGIPCQALIGDGVIWDTLLDIIHENRAMDALKYITRFRSQVSDVIGMFNRKLSEHHTYVRENLQDTPEIRNWRWTPRFHGTECTALQGQGQFAQASIQRRLNPRSKISYQHRSFTSLSPNGPTSGKASDPDFDCARGEKMRISTEEGGPSQRRRLRHGLRRVSFRADESGVSRLGLQGRTYSPISCGKGLRS